MQNTPDTHDTRSPGDEHPDPSTHQRPRYEHDCDKDTFLGQFEQFDLYVADHGGPAQFGGGTYIARDSDDGWDYNSGAVFVGTDPAITEAHRLATIRGIALPGIPERNDMTDPTNDPLTVAIEKSGLPLEPIDINTLVEHQREWAQKFTARGYALVDNEQTATWLHLDTGAFLPGYPEDNGVNVALWDDFFNPFSRANFDSDDAYLDAVEDRFRALWAKYDED